MCSDEGRVVDWLLDDARVDATAGLLPRGAAAGEGLRGRAHLALAGTHCDAALAVLVAATWIGTNRLIDSYVSS